jgi:hypothetical protein
MDCSRIVQAGFSAGTLINEQLAGGDSPVEAGLSPGYVGAAAEAGQIRATAAGLFTCIFLLLS